MGESMGKPDLVTQHNNNNNNIDDDMLYVFQQLELHKIQLLHTTPAEQIIKLVLPNWL